MTTPTITDVDGTISTGQTLAVSGSNLISLDTTNWIFGGLDADAYSFEGTGEAADGWEGDAAGTYVTNVKLLGEKSRYVNHAGAVSFPTNHTSAMYDLSWSSTQQDIYIAIWFRVKSNGGGYPTVQRKLFANYEGNGAWLDFSGNGGDPFVNWDYIDEDGEDNLFSINGGSAIEEEVWQHVEAKFPHGSPYQCQAWVMGALAFSSNAAAGAASANAMQIDTNHGETGAGYDFDLWIDGFAMSTSRIRPHSTYTISNSATFGAGTEKILNPLALTDTSASVRCNVDGISAPYYLFITNQQGETSDPYNLSGGGGSVGRGGSSLSYFR